MYIPKEIIKIIMDYEKSIIINNWLITNVCPIQFGIQRIFLIESFLDNMCFNCLYHYRDVGRPECCVNCGINYNRYRRGYVRINGIYLFF